MSDDEDAVESEKESIVGVTEGPAMDQKADADPVQQLRDLVDRCVADNMQIPIISQKVGVLNATFEEALDQLDIIDLLTYARDKLVDEHHGLDSH